MVLDWGLGLGIGDWTPPLISPRKISAQVTVDYFVYINLV